MQIRQSSGCAVFIGRLCLGRHSCATHRFDDVCRLQAGEKINITLAISHHGLTCTAFTNGSGIGLPNSGQLLLRGCFIAHASLKTLGQGKPHRLVRGRRCLAQRFHVQVGNAVDACIAGIVTDWLPKNASDSSAAFISAIFQRGGDRVPIGGINHCWNEPFLSWARIDFTGYATPTVTGGRLRQDAKSCRSLTRMYRFLESKRGGIRPKPPIPGVRDISHHVW
jgi:hypothetical protein